MMQTLTPLDGALLVDKPVGPTSHDVVAAVRRRFDLKKVGHCGTLDPNATGLLVLVLGRGTKLAEKLMSDDKVYEGEIKFGVTTDSYDADGTVTATAPVPPLTLEQLNRWAAEFVGDLMQVPPMVSAVKKGGVPLYKLARKGLEVEREPRLVHIYRFRFLEYREPIGRFELACTKGTYVRSIAHEIGQKAGCGAHLATLRRVQSGNFHVRDATPLDRVLQWSKEELERHVIPLLQLAQAAGLFPPNPAQVRP
ncbi:tRNA pseudouridine(55) synthase TruB [Limisphaera sp. VF-2]|jgi:tRNA pseudouridine55 synthase|uniref:tRNA pseudouridine(55) synthase TruB n=1 Tax=Limisphaera sp. VF-2 TaxID=3400418 RepID=UPI001757E254